MAPHTFHVFTVSPSDEEATIKTLWTHTPKPITVAKAHYFLSSSHLSPILQNSPITDSSPFNLVTILPGSSKPLPPSIPLTTTPFSFIADLAEEWTSDYSTRNSALLHPSGSPEAPFPLEPETPPNPDEEEVEFPLTTELRAFLSTFSLSRRGPVTMFNLLSFHKDQFPQYQLYMAGFQEHLGPKFGCLPRLLGPLAKTEDVEGEGLEWEMVGWIHYPSAAAFGRMLEDEAYKNLDRRFKRGVVRDNPILLVVELEE